MIQKINLKNKKNMKKERHKRNQKSKRKKRRKKNLKKSKNQDFKYLIIILFQKQEDISNDVFESKSES